MFYVLHRLGSQSNVIVSARYEGADLTRSAILDALRTVVLKHSALWHVFVRQPWPKKPDEHILQLAILTSIDLEKCVEFIVDDSQGVTTDILERAHNEWLYTADEPDGPWWKLIIKGQDILFVYHHNVGDGRSGQTFHREFLDALNSPTTGTYVVKRADFEGDVPADAMSVWNGKINMLELLWLTLVLYSWVTWYGSSRIYNNFPAPKPILRSATTVAKPEDRTVTRIVSHRIPAAKMARILAACRENQVTFTPLLMVMLTIVLAAEFYPDAKAGFSRYVYDLRRYLPMDRVGGATEHGTMFNASSNVQHVHGLDAFRRAIPQGKLSARDTPLKSASVWPLVKQYRDVMAETALGKGMKMWYAATTLPQTLEGAVSGTFSSMEVFLPPTYHVSNLGSFSADRARTKPFRITDMQFSVALTNGTISTRGLVFSVAGVKGGDTVVLAAYEEGVATREQAQDILDRVMARMYEV